MTELSKHQHFHKQASITEIQVSSLMKLWCASNVSRTNEKRTHERALRSSRRVFQLRGLIRDDVPLEEIVSLLSPQGIAVLFAVHPYRIA
ncbi:hypothetical protein [Vibrio harveyi]|uniref:hypothetical protein n=1 Tax=Vibrio harveyi TaxID=669 RepID=UPI0012D7CB1B|nr:hypothetical protein [Vibrio harveyi]